MAKECQYTREQLLKVMGGYLTMIERDNGKYPAVVLDDISKSIEYVLKQNDYDRSKDNFKGGI